MNSPRSDEPADRSDHTQTGPAWPATPLDGGCYAVIFASQRRDPAPGYGQAADRMLELAALQPGFLGVESARGEDGFGITVSYWRSLEDIRAWRDHAEHSETRERGRRDWYDSYRLSIARVERAYAWQLQAPPEAPR